MDTGKMCRIGKNISFLLLITFMIFYGNVFSQPSNYIQPDPFGENINKLFDQRIQSLKYNLFPPNSTLEVSVNLCSNGKIHTFSLPVDSRGVAIKEYNYYLNGEELSKKKNQNGIGYSLIAIVSKKDNEAYLIEYILNYSTCEGWEESKKGEYIVLSPVKRTQTFSGDLDVVLKEWGQVTLECSEVKEVEELDRLNIVRFRLTQSSPGKRD